MDTKPFAETDIPSDFSYADWRISRLRMTLSDEEKARLDACVKKRDTGRAVELRKDLPKLEPFVKVSIAFVVLGAFGTGILMLAHSDSSTALGIVLALASIGTIGNVAYMLALRKVAQPKEKIPSITPLAAPSALFLVIGIVASIFAYLLQRGVI